MLGKSGDDLRRYLLGIGFTADEAAYLAAVDREFAAERRTAYVRLRRARLAPEMTLAA